MLLRSVPAWQKHRPRASRRPQCGISVAFGGTQATDISTDSGYGRTSDPDMAPGNSPGPDVDVIRHFQNGQNGKFHVTDSFINTGGGVGERSRRMTQRIPVIIVQAWRCDVNTQRPHLQLATQRPHLQLTTVAWLVAPAPESGDS